MYIYIYVYYVCVYIHTYIQAEESEDHQQFSQTLSFMLTKTHTLRLIVPQHNTG